MGGSRVSLSDTDQRDLSAVSAFALLPRCEVRRRMYHAHDAADLLVGFFVAVSGRTLGLRKMKFETAQGTS